MPGPLKPQSADEIRARAKRLRAIAEQLDRAADRLGAGDPKNIQVRNVPSVTKAIRLLADYANDCEGKAEDGG